MQVFNCETLQQNLVSRSYYFVKVRAASTPFVLLDNVLDIYQCNRSIPAASFSY